MTGPRGRRDLAPVAHLPVPGAEGAVVVAGVERLVSGPTKLEQRIPPAVEREVSARQSHCGESRIRPPSSLPARCWRTSTRHRAASAPTASAHLGASTSSKRSRRRVLGPPARQTHLPSPSRHSLPGRAAASPSPPPPVGLPLGSAMTPNACTRTRPPRRVPLCHREGLHPFQGRPPTCSSSLWRRATNGPAGSSPPQTLHRGEGVR